MVTQNLKPVGKVFGFIPDYDDDNYINMDEDYGQLPDNIPEFHENVKVMSDERVRKLTSNTRFYDPRANEDDRSDERLPRKCVPGEFIRVDEGSHSLRQFGDDCIDLMENLQIMPKLFEDCFDRTPMPIEKNKIERNAVNKSSIVPALDVLNRYLTSDIKRILLLGSGDCVNDLRRIAKAAEINHVNMRSLVVDSYDNLVEEDPVIRKELKLMGKRIIYSRDMLGKYDMITCFHSMHYILANSSKDFDPLSHLYNILNDGGIVLGTYPDPNGFCRMEGPVNAYGRSDFNPDYKILAIGADMKGTNADANRMQSIGPEFERMVTRVVDHIYYEPILRPSDVMNALYNRFYLVSYCSTADYVTAHMAKNIYFKRGVAPFMNLLAFVKRDEIEPYDPGSENFFAKECVDKGTFDWFDDRGNFEGIGLPAPTMLVRQDSEKLKFFRNYYVGEKTDGIPGRYFIKIDETGQASEILVLPHGSFSRSCDQKFEIECAVEIKIISQYGSIKKKNLRYALEIVVVQFLRFSYIIPENWYDGMLLMYALYKQMPELFEGLIFKLFHTSITEFLVNCENMEGVVLINPLQPGKEYIDLVAHEIMKSRGVETRTVVVRVPFAYYAKFKYTVDLDSNLFTFDNDVYKVRKYGIDFKLNASDFFLDEHSRQYHRVFEFSLDGTFIRSRDDKKYGNNPESIKMLRYGLNPNELLQYENFVFYAFLASVAKHKKNNRKKKVDPPINANENVDKQQLRRGPIRWNLRRKMELIGTAPWMISGLEVQELKELIVLREALLEDRYRIFKNPDGRTLV